MTEYRPDEEIPKRAGTEGGRFAGSTDESGPMKPGNSVEEKTLRTGKGETQAGRVQCRHVNPRPGCLDRHRDRGSRGREVAVIAWRSRHSTVQERTRKRVGVANLEEIPRCKRTGVKQVPGPGQKAPGSPVILSVKGDHGESEVKAQDVLAKVYEPGRLWTAWQRVKKNAGAAGIDRMTVGEFAHREESLLALIHDKLQSGTYRFQPARRVLIYHRILSNLMGSVTDRRAVYLAGTYRSVGRG